MSNFKFSSPGQPTQPRQFSRISDLIQRSASALNPDPAHKNPLRSASLSHSPQLQSQVHLSSGHAQGSSRPTLLNPSQLFQNVLEEQPVAFKPITNTVPDFLSAGSQISQVAAGYGYTRGQVITDKAVIKAMMNKAGELYHIPGEFLYRTAMRESGARHWDDAGHVVSGAAVGLMQIEKSAHSKVTKTGPEDALNNAYDLGNNIALGAENLSRALKNLAKKGYKGSDPVRDLLPLVNISYNAGSGALSKAMEKARTMGLDQFNWQHLAFGRNVSIPAGGKFNVPGDWIETAPLHLALKEIHDDRSRQGLHNYPIYWTDNANIQLHDFDNSGTTTRAEHLISRIVYTLTGQSLKTR